MEFDFTLQQRIFVMTSYWKTRSIDEVHTLWRQNYRTEPPPRSLILRLSEKFEKEGTLQGTISNDIEIEDDDITTDKLMTAPKKAESEDPDESEDEIEEEEEVDEEEEEDESEELEVDKEVNVKKKS